MGLQFVFLQACPFGDVCYLRSVSRDDELGCVDRTIMLKWTENGWSHYEIAAPTVAHCVADHRGRTVYSLSPYGDVHVARPSGFSWERVDSEDEAPNRLRQLRDISVVGDSLFAVGMARMAYQRHPNGVWQRIDATMRTAGEITGLLSVAGHREDSVYACGFNGQIWKYDGTSWTQSESPTNVKLERVCIISDDLVAISGARGMMILGDGENWRVIKQTEAKATIWGVEYFNGRVYAADHSNVYVIDDDELTPVELPGSGEFSTGRLSANGGLLWSVGHSDVLVFDGQDWASVEVPGG